jgi:hypothetical protein
MIAMTTFTIDSDNSITAFPSLEEAQAAGLAGAEYFSSQEDLTQLAASSRERSPSTDSSDAT